MESCNLPSELLIDIMVRLPVKSLLRFKSVCKFLYNLIKNDHYFLHKHYEINKLKSSHVVRESGDPIKRFHLLSIESGSDEIGCIYLDVKIEETRYVKCCRGMLCLILGGGRPNKRYSDEDLPVYNILIWNPTTREVKSLPSITIPYKPSNKQVMWWQLCEQFGFGFSNDMTWKIVMLLHIQDLDPSCRRGDIHSIVMVCSRIGDSWSWRQIDAVPHFILVDTQDFYLKGRYYWLILNPCVLTGRHQQLLWFDMGDESFGTLEFELPSNFTVETVLVTSMNETIALFCFPNVSKWGNLGRENRIEIWLMNEINGNINWYKQTSINCCTTIYRHEYWSPKGPWDEYWIPIGIWNLDKHLLVFPHSTYGMDEGNEYTYVPYLLSIDLATQENKIIYMTEEKKTIYFVPNSMGYVQVYNEKEIHITEEWRGPIAFPIHGMYARVYHESLYSL